MRRTSSWTSINRNPRKGNLSLFICLHTILQVKDIGVLSYYMSLGSLVPLLKQMAIFLDWSYFAFGYLYTSTPCCMHFRPKTEVFLSPSSAFPEGRSGAACRIKSGAY